MKDNIYIFTYVQDGKPTKKEVRHYALSEEQARLSFEKNQTGTPTKIISIKTLFAGTWEHVTYRAEMKAKAEKDGFAQAVKMLGYEKAVKMFGKPN